MWQANAHKIKKIASAKAAVTQAKGNAMADVMSAKAAAWSQYGDNACVSALITAPHNECCAGLFDVCAHVHGPFLACLLGSRECVGSPLWVSTGLDCTSNIQVLLLKHLGMSRDTSPHGAKTKNTRAMLGTWTW